MEIEACFARPANGEREYTTVAVTIPNDLAGDALRAEIKRHAPGPEWRLVGFVIVGFGTA